MLQDRKTTQLHRVCLKTKSFAFFTSKIKILIVIILATLGLLYSTRSMCSSFISGALVPSQFHFSDRESARQAIPAHLEHITVPMKDGSHINCFILPPKNAHTQAPLKTNRCVLYCNPNAWTTAHNFSGKKKYHTALRVHDLTDLPIVLFDYRGTGINKIDHFIPTPKSIIEDGAAVLEFISTKYDHIDVMGSSLGGAVATFSVDIYIKNHPDQASKCSLINHDSFTTTARVVLPALGWIADVAGSLLGGQMDARPCMKRILSKKVATTVLCHLDDPVIPKGARMAEFIKDLPEDLKNQVTVISSPEYGHAHLSPDMTAPFKKAFHRID